MKPGSIGRKMIAIVDVDLGNTGSIQNMLSYLGIESFITQNPEELNSASKIILPGVGSFDTGITNLKKYGMFDKILEQSKIQSKIILGICLGMQLLGNRSEEGQLEGLKLIDFDTKKFNFEDKKIKIPHMGWNHLFHLKDKDLFNNITELDRFYFVHSYYAKTNSETHDIAQSDYYSNFTAAVNHSNTYGVQFHPEKSHHFGMKLLKNFGELNA